MFWKNNECLCDVHATAGLSFTNSSPGLHHRLLWFGPRTELGVTIWQKGRKAKEALDQPYKNVLPLKSYLEHLHRNTQKHNKLTVKSLMEHHFTQNSLISVFPPKLGCDLFSQPAACWRSGVVTASRADGRVYGGL